MIDKTLTGVAFFDERYGGAYRHRPMIVCGRSGMGKTVFALQFVMQGVLQDERCLLLSAWRANDLVIFAESLGFPLSQAIDSGRLIVLEYNQYVPGRDKEWNLVLPPEGFLQLEELIRTQAVHRVVLDTVLPWVCIPEHQRLDEHLFSFVRAFDRMHVTTVLTMPKPVSPLAFRVKNTLENLAPVSVTLAREGSQTQFVVSKYLGESRLAGGTPYRILKGRGIVSLDQAGATPFERPAAAPAAAPSVGSPVAPPAPALAFSSPFPPPAPAAGGNPVMPGPLPRFAPPAAAAAEAAPASEPRPAPGAAAPGKPIRFSSLMPGLDRITPIPERKNLHRPF